MEKYIVELIEDEIGINMCIALRQQVFSKEFNIKKEEENDIYDLIANHFGIYQKGYIIACERLIIMNNKAVFSRLVVDEEYRNKGLAKKINIYIEEYIKNKGINKVYLNSTKPKFHKKLGYSYNNRIYIDSGILVYSMYKEL